MQLTKETSEKEDFKDKIASSVYKQARNYWNNGKTKVLYWLHSEKKSIKQL